MGEHDWALYLFIAWGVFVPTIRLVLLGAPSAFLFGAMFGGLLMGSIMGLIARDLLRKGMNSFIVVVVGMLTGPLGLLIAEIFWLIRGWSKSEDEGSEPDEIVGEDIAPKDNASQGGGKVNKALPVVLGLLLVVSVVGNVFLYSGVQNRDTKISSLQADLTDWKDNYSKLDEHAKSLEEQLNEANSKLAEYEKQVGELQKLVAKYEEDLEGLKDQIDELNTQLDDKNAQISILQGQLSTAQTDLDNLKNLYENMKFGMGYEGLARLNWESGDRHYDLAGMYYDMNYFSNASEYYQNAKSYYKWAKQYYLKAESYLKTALQYAEGDERELVNNYLKAAEYGVKLMDAMYFASSYMANACDAYASGDYESGDYWLDKANEKIEDYNSYLDNYNLYAGKIDEYFGID